MPTTTEAVLAAKLRATAERLERMIASTITGGWSTQNVDAMREEVTAIYSLLGRLGL